MENSLYKSLSCQREEQLYNGSVMVCGEFEVQREYHPKSNNAS